VASLAGRNSGNPTGHRGEIILSLTIQIDKRSRSGSLGFPARRFTIWQMRTATIAAAVIALVVPAAAQPVPPPPLQLFHVLREGLVPSNFHARRDGNRVFYATSAKEARRWLPFTGAHLPASFFKQYALLAIFYRPSPGAIPTVSSVRVSPPPANNGAPGTHRSSTLVAGVTLSPVCPGAAAGGAVPSCRASIWGSGTFTTCSHGSCSPVWGVYLLEAIDKSPVGPTRVNRVIVNESVAVPAPPQCSPPNGCVAPYPPPPLPQ
jgi:hypothetical protein